MAKRVLDLTGRELASISAREFKDAVKASEGRVVAAEVVVASKPLVDGVSNVELAARFGADILILNMYDALNPSVEGVPEVLASLQGIAEFVQRFVGNNLEPVEEGLIPEGRRLSEKTVKRSIELGSRLIVVTGNPGLGVTWDKIAVGVEKTVSITGTRALVFGGKMHSGGLKNEKMYDLALIERVMSSGADGVLVPAPFTVPGASPENIEKVVSLAEKYDALVMCTIGTSQEGSPKEVIRSIALHSKACGCDIHHIGDSGYSMGVAIPENILELSLAVRGVRHTYKRISMSHLR
ncbi:haloacid dehalogenase-like hydrolase [Infirmifilum lucidum]|uniref:Haloacid dehalogenase-like hydrolase n=1 Tax=Infirmifilum lucidum TaxID=2776706 RepID=A0A7L9FJP1_9CREN|nr:haloacid dehalogenase-like hydrolase [Infirmifilum lucidum]QOJ79233.1 haloacid dehalogenase-like hydrolase [Infirmifilum lucidum]